MKSKLIATFAVLALVVCSFAVPAAAQAESQQPTGAWTAQVSMGPMSFRALMTFGRDGTLIVSQAALVPMGPNTTWVFSDAHGAWKRTADGRASFKFVSLLHDTSGNFVGIAVVSGSAAVDSAGALSANVTASDILADGTVLFSFPATLTATRITAD